MESNQLRGNWKQLRGKIKEKWGELTDDDLDRIDGKRDQLVGRLQVRYGESKELAEKHVDEFLKADPQ